METKGHTEPGQPCLHTVGKNKMSACAKKKKKRGQTSSLLGIYTLED